MFCDRHIERFLLLFRQDRGPLDLLLSRYFKANKALGSKDRKLIGDTVYGMVRFASLLDFARPKGSPLEQLTFYRSSQFIDLQKEGRVPDPVRLGIPAWIYQRLILQFGADEGKRLSSILNTQAPMTIRANLLKTTREALLALLPKEFPATLCKYAPHGLQFAKRAPLFSLPQFKEGLFELQDEGSQLAAQLVEARPGDLVLDFCSGSGGKTLAFAPQMEGKGQIYLHDIRPAVLQEAKKRLKRAGIQNAQCLIPGHPQLKKLQGKCDWVVIDVPCSGTGTFRRNPDQKWRLEESMLHTLVAEQKAIAKEALPYLKPGGKLVYMTCSLFQEENEQQLEALLSSYPLSLVKPPLRLLPEEGGMDGFFGAQLLQM